MSSPYNSEGQNRQEDIRLKSIARNRLTSALAQEALRIRAIVTAILPKINEDRFRFSTVENIWNALQNHPNLASLKLDVERYAGAYSDFQTLVTNSRSRVEREQRARIEEAKNPISSQHSARYPMRDRRATALGQLGATV